MGCEPSVCTALMRYSAIRDGGWQAGGETVTMDTEHREGSDVPARFLDTDYNGLCFHVCQAFFPCTAAWDDLKRSLKGQFEDSVWDHLAGTRSEPFEGGEQGQVAVKVIDDRGNELLVVRSLKEAEA